jgi:hypothetical protein
MHVKVCLGQRRQAFQAKLIMYFQNIAATAFAYVGKDKVEKRVFYFGEPSPCPPEGEA